MLNENLETPPPVVSALQLTSLKYNTRPSYRYKTHHCTSIRRPSPSRCPHAVDTNAGTLSRSLKLLHPSVLVGVQQQRIEAEMLLLGHVHMHVTRQRKPLGPELEAGFDIVALCSSGQYLQLCGRHVVVQGA